MLPVPIRAEALGERIRPGLVLERSERASDVLLSDLRSDEGMGWLPGDDVWLTYLRVDAHAGDLTYDLAVDASGAGRPAPTAAGLDGVVGSAEGRPAAWIVLTLLATLALVAELERRRSARPAV